MSSNNSVQPLRRMPAEWEPHEATWIAWPHHEPDWPDKLEAIRWAYAEIVRTIGLSERVEILCHDEDVAAEARLYLTKNDVNQNIYRLHQVANDRGWLRDSAPTAVRTANGAIEWIAWQFKAWAKYDNYLRDAHVPRAIQEITGLPGIEATRPDEGGRVVLEGGAIDTDGQGTLLTTEECLLSRIQWRNPGLDRAGYEKIFAEYLGIRQTIWLGDGCAGDDTHGHVDDIARFVAPQTVVCVHEPDPGDENHAPSQENLRRLQAARNAEGRELRVVTLPMPRPISYEGQRLPASYANFYITNRCVLVPTFNDQNDRIALNTLADLFPDRRIIGLAAADLVLGQGTLHCLTQQQPSL
ncbi:MAG: agmatine deiminase family protein [Phycisphaerales bacterium]|nr:agmatine deiminase family protein [Phycisphaerales bacterium]